MVYASTVAEKWGANRVGQVYAWLFSANIPAALAPMLAGFVFDLKGSFTLVLTILALALVLIAVFFAKFPESESGLR